MIKGLRKLASGERRRSATRTEKSEIAITAPKMIIRALYPYTARSDDEITFGPNDYLYVIDASDPEWYFASDPLKNLSGLVPSSYFEIIQRQEPTKSVSLTQAINQQTGSSPPPSSRKISQSSLGHSGSISPRGTRSASHSASHSISHLANPSLASAMSTGGPSSTSAASRYSHSRGPSQASGPRSMTSPSSKKSSGPVLALYGFVLYDFTAERNDELTASAGESIVVIAQSNEEWFVAKPIGRLGGPGLIPVSYVELREVGTDIPVEDVADAVVRAGIPHVEEWKRRAAEYKASSIPLGKLETTTSTIPSATTQRTSAASSSHHQRNQSHGSIQGYRQSRGHMRSQSRTQPGTGASSSQGRSINQELTKTHTKSASTSGAATNTTSTAGIPRIGSAGAASSGDTAAHIQPRHHHENTAGLETPYVTDANVDRFAINDGRYWYLVKAKMSNGTSRNLCRFYQDFYDFQIRLLEDFPAEAGRTGQTRTLPFMPGPLTLVSPKDSSQRRAGLDEYVRALIRMPAHISRSPVVLQLFEVRSGDINVGVDADADGDTKKSGMLPQPPGLDSGAPGATESEYFGELPEMYASMAPISALPSGDVDANSSAPSGPEPISKEGTVKVKIYSANDVIAIRVAASLPFADVYRRLASRLDVEAPQLYTSEGPDGILVDSQEAYEHVVAGGSKVAFYVR